MAIIDSGRAFLRTRNADIVQDWRLHVGAHKTATTHLQDRLALLTDVLAQQGVGFASLEQIRPARALDLRRRRPLTWIGGAPLRREILQRLSARVTPQPRMVLSEEDILGNSTAPILPGFYPRAETRVRTLASALLAGGRGSLWISVRSLDRFLPAAYATALKHNRLPLDSAALRARALADPPDWSGLVMRLRAAAPGVPITVWDYGDYRQNAQAIAEALTGARFERMPEIPDPAATRTPDAAAIADAEAIQEALPPLERARRVAEIYEAAEGPRFTLFSEPEAARLRALHAGQMDRIAGLDGVRILRF